VDGLRAVRNRYAAAHGIESRNDSFDWKELRPVFPGFE
jgi:hypothetical protein